MRKTLLLSTGLLLFGGAASAGVAQVHHVDLSSPARRRAERFTTDAVRALTRGDHARALSLANQAIAADPTDPWGYYDRGAALAGLLRTDEALVAFRQAEDRLGDDAWGTSVAIYGRANALALVGRCDEAGRAYRDYADYVRPADEGMAATARRYAVSCVTSVAPIARRGGTPAPSERQPVRGTASPERQPLPGRDSPRR